MSLDPCQPLPFRVHSSYLFYLFLSFLHLYTPSLFCLLYFQVNRCVCFFICALPIPLSKYTHDLYKYSSLILCLHSFSSISSLLRLPLSLTSTCFPSLLSSACQRPLLRKGFFLCLIFYIPYLFVSLFIPFFPIPCISIVSFSYTQRSIFVFFLLAFPSSLLPIFYPIFFPRKNDYVHLDSTMAVFT